MTINSLMTALGSGIGGIYYPYGNATGSALANQQLLSQSQYVYHNLTTVFEEPKIYRGSLSFVDTLRDEIKEWHGDILS